MKADFSSKLIIITARKRSLGQGNVFTGVCLSTGGVGFPPCITGHMTSIQGGLRPGGRKVLPPPELEKRVVGILLQYFLVEINCLTMWPFNKGGLKMQ